ncbi:hypothetical protein [Actinotalea solisilvae]|uniref:hypothetical protein n=1 Tax=Actinotalea solisilvae TaxID=2072922 RepID=UPI0018F19DAB|nr:hypothetical protein [Actinotalea solisilvae]
MSEDVGVAPSGSRWMARSVAIGLVGVALTTVGVLALADAVPRRGAVLLVLGLPLLAVGVASLAAAMRVEARHHAVAVLRPHDDVVEVSLGDGWVDALPAAGADPGPVGIALLRHVTAAVGDEGVGLWAGGATPSLAALVPWSAVTGVAPGASTTVNGASSPAVAIGLPGATLLLVPRRGASGDGWAGPEETVRLVERWAARRAGSGDVTDVGVTAVEPAEVEPAEVDQAGTGLNAGHADVAVPRPPVAPTAGAADGDHAAAPRGVGTGGESIDDRIRRLAGTDD